MANPHAWVPQPQYECPNCHPVKIQVGWEGDLVDEHQNRFVLNSNPWWTAPEETQVTNIENESTINWNWENDMPAEHLNDWQTET